MRLYLINPSNPLTSMVNFKENRWNRYRVWKPLSLMVLASVRRIRRHNILVVGSFIIGLDSDKPG
ncbi:MAG: hypothetical protein NTY64_01885, partial [Deltaproteobacteria bacterium]|nr:hypothetical protein [Deltaproteobacteria bacterium]